MPSGWVTSTDAPAATCDRAVVFAPAGELVPVALRAVRAGGTVALAGIHMSDVPAMRYELLWHERTLRSVANMTRADAQEFMDLAAGRQPARRDTRCSRSTPRTTRSCAIAEPMRCAAPRSLSLI